MSETPYVETEALLAVMEGDPKRAEELLNSMSGSELRAFDAQLDLLGDAVGRARYRKRREGD